MTNPGLSGGRAVLELAERVEKATGPDRTLDGAVAALLSGHEVQRVTVGPDHRREDFTFIDRDGAAPVSRPVPRYTASLDAALSLVPEGSDCSLWWGTRGGKVIATTEIDGAANSLAATPALALCAAALRVRAADTPSVKP